MKQIVLASGSPRRKEILAKTRLPFRVIVSDYEEDMTQDVPPGTLVEQLSLEKAQDVAVKVENSVIIAADTIIVCGKTVLGKPHTAEKAKDMLKMISGQKISSFTGVTIIDTDTKKIVTFSQESWIWMKEMTEQEIDAYIASGEPLDRAGAFAIQELGAVLVEKSEGDFLNIVGLPLFRLVQELKAFGIHVLL